MSHLSPFLARAVPTVAVVVLAAVPLAACGSDSPNSASSIAVTATDRECKIDKARVAAGKHTLAVTNKGSDVTEVYVYGEGDKVMGEVENIGPGTSRSFTVDLGGGTYEVACKPGMKGDGIRTKLTVTGAAKATPVPDRTIELVAFDYGYQGLDRLAITRGESIELQMRNEAPELEHELEVLGPDGKALGEVGPTKPGRSGSVMVTFDRAGTYTIVCGIDDHEEHGMVTKLHVS